MHLEICVEDASGKILVEQILARILREDVSWRVHGYRGVGRIPKDLKSTENASHRILLDSLPKLIRGCANTPYVTALIFIVDTDKKDCKEFLQQLKALHLSISPKANVIFRLAIEEMESWLLGDSEAIKAAYPNVIEGPLKGYIQDSVCGTWEVLADAIHPGGAAALKAAGWPAPGEAKCNWARNIPPHMNFDGNKSPSFQRLLKALAPFT
jgi:hypothetical protein